MSRRKRRNSSQFPCDHSHIQPDVKLVASPQKMKNLQELLAQKELELARVEKEVEALRIVAPLLRDEEDSVSEAAEPTRTAAVMLREAVQDETVKIRLVLPFGGGALARNSASKLRNRPMSTAPTIRLITSDDPRMSQLAEMYEAYFTTLESQAVRFENVAAKLEDGLRRTVLDFVAGLRKEVQTLREQIDLLAEWG
jgi:hypothetical protein